MNHWNFSQDYNDHFETPLQAYQDIKKLLLEVARRCNKSLEEIVIYDPYYCKGEVINRMKDIGVANVINVNEDFYMNIKRKKIPGM